VSSVPRADLTSVHVLLPVRGLRDGKARLIGVIADQDRERLIIGLLRRSLAVLADWPAAARVHVVSPDSDILRLATSNGASAIKQQPPDGLNAGLIAARVSAVAQGARTVVCLPADLPLLNVASLARLLDAADAAVAAGGGRAVVVIAPADSSRGTNALLLSPPAILEPLFGEQSFERHLRAAERAGASVQVVVDELLGFDLDTPADLARLPSAALDELRRLGSESAVGA
jgi:2-phospho-L-lactate guanylyltransferase